MRSSARWLLVLMLCAVLPPPDVEAQPRLRRPRRGYQIKVGPVAVPSGQELTECTYMKLPSRRDLAVNGVEIAVQGGSHHIHLYRPHDPGMTLADGHETCNFALDFEVWQLILASQNLFLRWKLPAGVAFHFRAGEQLAAQTHFVDNGLLATPEPGWAVFNLHTMPRRKVKSYAGSFFGQDRDVFVPPRSTASATTRCRFSKPVRLLALTGHYHFRGVRFVTSSWDGTTGSQLYEAHGYADPPFLTFGKPPEVTGLEWTCDYENPSDETYGFGPFTDRNEHCNLFAFYYPSAGTSESMTCVQEHGTATVTVRAP
jgi:hypothetical protein